MMKALSIALVLLMLVGALPIISAPTLADAPTIEDLAPADDVGCYNNFPDYNFNYLDYFGVGYGVYTNRVKSVLDFCVCGLSYTDIVNATLYIKPKGYSGYDLTFGTYPLLSSFDETTVTWNTCPALGSTASDTHVMTSSFDWIMLNVTTIIKEKCNGTAFGIGIFYISGTDCVDFASKEYTTDPSWQPYLKLEHTGEIGWAPTFTSTPVESTWAGQLYEYQVTTNCTATFSLTSSPEWMTINSTTGLVSGTPELGGTHDVTVKATGAYGRSYQSFTLTVDDWAPTFTSTPITVGRVGIYYVYDVETNCSTTFTLLTGPSWMVMDEDGMLYGIPDACGTFTVETSAFAVDGRGTSYQNYTLTISRGTSPSAHASDGIDGYITDGVTAYTGVEKGRVSQGASGSGESEHTYISIDTSGIPDNANIISAELYFFVEVIFTVRMLVYCVDYGPTLTVDDWNSYTDGTYLGYYGVTTYDSWVRVPFSASLVDATGSTQFEVLPYGHPSSLFYIYLSASAYAPYMLVMYEYGGTDIDYLDDAGAVLYTASVIPIKLEYNVTHDCYLIETDTWTSGRLNFTIPAEWEFYDATPYYTSSEDGGTYVLLNGTLGNLTYRAYFLCPRMMLSTVWFNMYDAATGIGYPFESFVMRVSPGSSYDEMYSETLTQSFARIIYDWTYTVAVFDYFGNEITRQSFSTSAEEVFMSIGVAVNSFKVFNQQDDFARIRIYYEGAGTPIEYFLAPWEPVERFLRDGNYTVTVTWYDNQTAMNTVYFNITVDGAEFLMLEGYTISRVISDVAGVRAVQEVITYMLTPDVVFIGENMPRVPNDAYDPGIELVHPWSVVHGWANGTEFTDETLFYYTYYTSRKYYEVTLNVTNDDGEDWTNVTWFIGFPENRTIDYSTVRIYDLNNECYLQAGLHYDMTLTGIRMKWTYFNDTLSRSFIISMYDANASSGGGLAIAYADSYEATTYDGNSYYLATASWTNSFSYAYTGQLQIKLDFENYDRIDASSVIVYDVRAGRALTSAEFTVGGGLITVMSAQADIGDVLTYKVYFKLDLSESSAWSMSTEFLGAPLWLWFVGVGIAGIFALVFVNDRVVKTGRGWKRMKLNDTAGAFVVCLLAIFFILWYFMEMGVV